MTRLKFSNFHVSISKCIISVTGRDIINLSNFSKNLIQEIESESIWGKFLSKFWSKIFGDFSVKKSWYRWFWFACCFFKWIIVFPSLCFSVMLPTFTVISRLNSRIFGLKNSVNWTWIWITQIVELQKLFPLRRNSISWEPISWEPNVGNLFFNFCVGVRVSGQEATNSSHISNDAQENSTPFDINPMGAVRILRGLKLRGLW